MKKKVSGNAPPWLKRKGNVVQIDSDLLPGGILDETMEIVAEKNRAPKFTGEVEHGYPLTAVSDPTACPTCGATTAWHSAEFIYITSIGMRAMYVPAGRFCSACPTVIVDQGMIAEGMVVSNAKFKRVVGVVNAKTKDPMYFSTWLGEKLVYILDENEQIEDMLTVSELEAPETGGLRLSPNKSKGSYKQKKAKRKQASKARKRNRGSKK